MIVTTIEGMVKTWRKCFKLEVNKEFTKDSFEKLSQDKIDLDIRLIREELTELEDALTNKDLVETLDAIGDLQFVLWQLYSRLGFSEVEIREITNEVYKSNMSKACLTREEAEATVDYYTTKDDITQTSCTIDDENPSKMLVFRSDGKLLKNIVGFIEPDFTNIIKKIK
jgi:predicted HAD superfamily Cof-like phosphohydrolase